MAVAHGASAESTVGTTSPRTWSHAAGAGVTPDWVLVFVLQGNSATDHITTVTYDGVALTAVPGAFAADTAGEPGSCKAYFASGGAWASGTVTVSVTEDGTGVEFYGVSISGSGSAAEVYSSSILLEQENQALAEENIDDGSPGTNSVRYAAAFYGRTTDIAAGANSTALQSENTSNGLAIYFTVRETTAGQGSRPVGIAAVNSDDVAAVYLAIRETGGGTQFMSIIVGV